MQEVVGTQSTHILPHFKYDLRILGLRYLNMEG